MSHKKVLFYPYQMNKKMFPRMINLRMKTNHKILTKLKK
jgi:hypothetical protein